MDVTQVASYMSIFKDLRSFWDNLNGADRDRADALLKRTVVTFLPEGTLDRQKKFFLESSDILPMKLAALALDNEVRSTVMAHIKTPSTDSKLGYPDDDRPIVKCRQCGGLQQLDI